MIRHHKSIKPRIDHSESFLPDGLMARRVLAGDKEAFVYFLTRYSTSVYTYIHYVIDDNEGAAGVLQQVFLRLYIHLPQMCLDQPFKLWLFQVAHTCCMDELRRKHHQKTSPFSAIGLGKEGESVRITLPGSASTPEIKRISVHHDMRHTVQQVIMMLPVMTREVVMLHTTFNMTFSQIGYILHMPEQTAYAHFHHARQTLLKEVLIKRYTEQSLFQQQEEKKSL